MGFTRTESDHGVFVSEDIFIAIYVDDLLIFGKDWWRTPLLSKLRLRRSPFPPAKRRGLATSIPSLPNFKLGYAETERQHVFLFIFYFV